MFLNETIDLHKKQVSDEEELPPVSGQTVRRAAGRQSSRRQTNDDCGCGDASILIKNDDDGDRHADNSSDDGGDDDGDNDGSDDDDVCALTSLVVNLI